MRPIGQHTRRRARRTVQVKRQHHRHRHPTAARQSVIIAVYVCRVCKCHARTQLRCSSAILSGKIAKSVQPGHTRLQRNNYIRDACPPTPPRWDVLIFCECCNDEEVRRSVLRRVLLARVGCDASALRYINYRFGRQPAPASRRVKEDGRSRHCCCCCCRWK